jgi:hypothetical protein
MVAGITLFGLLTANIASFFIERSGEADKQEAEDHTDRVIAKLDELLRRMDALEQTTEEAHVEGGSPPAYPPSML